MACKKWGGSNSSLALEATQWDTKGAAVRLRISSKALLYKMKPVSDRCRDEPCCSEAKLPRPI